MEYSRVTTVSRACVETYILINGEVLVFIAMRESCENSETRGEIFTLGTKFSLPDRNKRIRSMRKFKRALHSELTAVSTKIREIICKTGNFLTRVMN